MIPTFIIGLVVIVVGLAIVIALQPDSFRVSRSATIAAPASALFKQVNDLHLWEAWSPWAKMDPNVKNTYSGAASGVGAKFAWEGKKTGHGAMTLLESRPYDLIRIELQFFKPFQATNSVEFTFIPAVDGTTVTWSMSGQKNFVMKAMGLVMSTDKMCGPQFEQGLASMRSIVESTAPAQV